MLHAIAVLSLVFFTFPAEPPKRSAKDIEKDIEAAKAKLADLEGELAVARGETVMPLNLDSAKVGVVGRFGITSKDVGKVSVREVLDEKELIAIVFFVNAANPRQPIIGEFVISIPTGGVADGQVKDEWSLKMWKVSDTKELNGKTYFMLEPFGK